MSPTVSHYSCIRHFGRRVTTPVDYVDNVKYLGVEFNFDLPRNSQLCSYSSQLYNTRAPVKPNVKNMGSEYTGFSDMK